MARSLDVIEWSDAALSHTTPNDCKILVQGTAEWDQPIATNQHYMVRELGKAFQVTFVASLGLRRPELTSRDMKRAFQRLSPRASPGASRRPRTPSVSVLSPRVIPLHKKPWTVLNRLILNKTLHRWLDGEGPRVYWTYSPVTYGFEDHGDLRVYHCVDLYGEFPGIDGELIDRAERELALKDVIAIGSSHVVVKHLERQGFRHVLYWPNVADTETIRATVQGSREKPRSGVIFSGNLSEKKVDFDILARLVAAGVDLHLAGPVAEGGGESEAAVKRLIDAGAHYHGVLDLASLTTLMLRCKVGLIPYQLNSYTLGVSPLKTYEYLAAGLSVVATALPGVSADERHVARAADADDFIALVTAKLLEDGSAFVEQRVELAESHSWTQRGQDARNLVLEGLSGMTGASL